MNYKKLFDSLLLDAGLVSEQLMDSPDASQGGSPSLSSGRTHDVPPNAISPMLDQGTDPDSFLTQGIKDTFDSVRRHFNEKMAGFASDLEPDSAKASTVGELKEKVKKVYDFTNKVQVFSKAKIDAMAQDPYAIMAGFIASEPTQLAAFEELHKTLEEFSQAFEEIDAKLAGVSSKIQDFIKDSQKVKEPSLMQQNNGMQTPSAPLGGASRGAPPTGGSALPTGGARPKPQTEKPLV